MKSLTFSILLGIAALLITQDSNAGGTVADYRFFSKALNREMTCRVYLPEGYQPWNQEKRFPVIYFLHGASLGYDSYDVLYPIMDNLISFGLIKPVITVMPNGLTPPYNGSFYTNSSLYGNFEDYISHDLIAFTDSAFHTQKERGKRGIMGASMGAYGALKAAFRHQELFIGVAGHSGPVNTEMMDIFIPDLIAEDGGTVPFHWSPGPGKSLTNLTFTMAGAFSPNPDNLYQVDFPLDSMAVPIPEVMLRWKAENICEIARTFAPARTMGIRFDCGNADEFYLYYQNRALSDTLTKYNISHRYEEYAGTHTSGLPVRVPLSMIYFNLLFQTDYTGAPLFESKSDWKVYPNPAVDELMVTNSLNLHSVDNPKIQMTDAMGRVVLDRLLPEGINPINISNLPAGLYFYIIQSGTIVQTGMTTVVRQ